MTKEFFQMNRQRLVTQLKGGVIVLSAYSAMQRGNDASFGFEQEANFWWLTGIESPEWWVIIDGSRQKTWLVRPEVSDTHELFDGSLPDITAMKVSGASDVINRDEATTMLRDLAKKHSVVNTIGDHPYGEHFDFIVNPAQKKLWTMLERLFTNVEDCQVDMAKLRAIKQPEEIRAIKKAISLTVDAFEYVKQKLPSLNYEYEVEAEFTYFFRKAGALGHAYDPIVAAGHNACTLHYNINNSRMKKKELLLIDIGARLDGYAADITRTYGLGDATARQKHVHMVLETAHHQIIKLIHPGLLVSDYQEQVDEIMQHALSELGLLKNTDDYRRYFPHAISHGLGIDVHDSLGRATELQTGMILTVEPGIYIPEEGIGVRIEDDILVTETGQLNLSKRLSTSL